jgi:hypothetical protein
MLPVCLCQWELVLRKQDHGKLGIGRFVILVVFGENVRGTKLKNSKRGFVCAVFLDKISASTRDIVGWKDEGKLILVSVFVFDEFAKLIIRTD